MGFTDTVKWQEKALGIMDRGLSVIAYNNYLEHGRGLILIQLRLCLGDKKLNEGMQYVRLGSIKPIEGLRETIEMVESYEPLLEYVISVEPYEKYEKGVVSRTYLRYLVMSH